MNEVIGHIFGDLERHDKSIRYVNSVLRNQMNINKNVAMFAGALTAYIVITEIRNRERDKRIRYLNRKLEGFTD